ncbi:MAG: hypothetical protein HQRvContig03_38 [Haloquadratum phage sp.]|nr:MAG: hypothetical protein HQRvContig03_38 [Haloquadratum phage sp.]
MSEEVVTDRAQFTTPRLVPALFVAVAVLAVVAAELRDHVAAVDGPVEYCGLCHVEPVLEVIPLISLALLAIAFYGGIVYGPRP